MILQNVDNINSFQNVKKSQRLKLGLEMGRLREELVKVIAASQGLSVRSTWRFKVSTLLNKFTVTVSQQIIKFSDLELFFFVDLEPLSDIRLTD